MSSSAVSRYPPLFLPQLSLPPLFLPLLSLPQLSPLLLSPLPLFAPLLFRRLFPSSLLKAFHRRVFGVYAKLLVGANFGFVFFSSFFSQPPKHTISSRCDFTRYTSFIIFYYRLSEKAIILPKKRDKILFLRNRFIKFVQNAKLCDFFAFVCGRLTSAFEKQNENQARRRGWR